MVFSRGKSVYGLGKRKDGSDKFIYVGISVLDSHFRGNDPV